MENALNKNILDRHFELEINGHQIFVEYQENLNVISLIYTHIPDNLIGKGAFRLIAESMISYAKAARVKLTAIDTLFRNYLIAHPEHREMLNDPDSEPARKRQGLAY